MLEQLGTPGTIDGVPDKERLAGLSLFSSEILSIENKMAIQTE